MKSLRKELIIGIISTIIGLAAVITAYVLNFDKGPFGKAEWYIYVLYISGSIFTLIAFGNLYRVLADKYKIGRKITVKQMSLVSVMSAITVVLYYYAKFNLPFFPGWLDIQVSEIPALITSFIYGPATGCLIILIRFFVKLPGTMTVGVGELADLLLGLVLVIISGNIYKKHHTLKGALASLGIAMGVSTVVACLSNMWILIPAYTKLAGFSYDTLIGMMSYVPNLTEQNFMFYYILIGVIPFNLFRYAIVFGLTVLLYKRISWLFDKIAPRKEELEEVEKEE